MASLTSTALFILCTSTLVSTQVLRFKKCPEFKVVENFNATRYFDGRWYEQKRFWAIFEVGSKCVNADYTMKSDGNVKVDNNGVYKFGRRGQIGDAYCDNGTANCYVKFYDLQPYGSYNVLSTDYDKYGLVYSCSPAFGGLGSSSFAWILTRNKVVPDEDMQSYLQIFEDNEIDTRYFRDVAQDCDDN